MFTVECARGFNHAIKSYDVLEIPYKKWLLILELGESIGWQPTGTVFSERLDRLRGQLPLDKQDYEPRDWYWSKIFMEDDALALAEVLEAYLKHGNIESNKNFIKKISKLLFGDKSKIFTVHSELDEKYIKTFIEFLLRGEFQFAFDD